MFLKRILPVLAAAILLCPLCACAPETPPESSGQQSESSGEESPAPSLPTPEMPPPQPIPDDPVSPPITPPLPEPVNPPAPAPLEADNRPVTEGTYPEMSSAKGLNPNNCAIFVQDKGTNTVASFTDDLHNRDFATLVNAAILDNPAGGPLSGNAEASFMVILDEDQSKIFISLVNGSLLVGDESYGMTSEDYASLKALASAEITCPRPQWLVYMNPERVTGVSYNTDPGQGEQKMPADSGWLGYVYELRSLAVQPGRGTRFAPKAEAFTPSADDYQTKLTFDSGVVYTLTFHKDELSITSSDMKDGWRYLLHDPTFVDYLRAYAVSGTPPQSEAPAEDNANPATAKPVIYLYPESTRDVEVRLDFKGELSYTFPSYNGGWSVTAQPDGTLTNRADGSTHYYLFWDGYADRQQWDLSKGFVVAGTDVEAFFADKLPKLGLTPREYNDFITYWTPELRRNPYNLITFSTTEYEEAAPLTITPAPDNILRVHMVYKALTAPVQVEEQTLPSPPARTGFTVVEWGGTRAK